MGDWRRYAIYHTPEGPLAAFGAEWLGWDIARGREGRDRPAGVEALTRAARRYGFHATLKAPFRLAADSSEAALLADLRALAAGQPPVSLPGGLRLAALHGFPALVPAQPCAPLQQLAARVVRALDAHRAPLTPEDRARRNPDRLSEAQRNLLDRWGYPFVLGQFRFHMTLGARLEGRQSDALLAALHPHLAPLLPDPHPIASLTLAGEDAMGRFHQIARLRLRDAQR
ncbi:DUF1045 domain-containing protein [Paracoccus spongiarum]|uniref:DUF1045 domain-containing protein n=1 Tax=Paracoccus spongiarum TaxID=3064387 RepID=A0ABT9JCY8_9RHOB|nr:DUF1045 domain-containing protein [Paracoccus sp. 2205BS29-5]MDP5307676.1 DUF1045 domain-containing protein [Paracoccus sp. 2205BS29-5]